VAEDLTRNVAALADATVHLMESWDPEEKTNDYNIHLAAWPLAVEPETGEILALGGANTGAFELIQLFSIQVWESAGSDSTRRVRNEEATSTFLQLHNDVRARFFVAANMEGLLGNYLIKYRRTEFPEELGAVRWFRIVIEVHRLAAITEGVEMADPKKVKFYRKDGAGPVMIADPSTGEHEQADFPDGVCETSNPLWIKVLSKLADDPNSPISQKA
jgi:hypothetical protein